MLEVVSEQDGHIERVKAFIRDSEEQLKKARKVLAALEKSFPSKNPNKDEKKNNSD